MEEIARTKFDQSVGSILVKDNGHLEGIIIDRGSIVKIMVGSGDTNIFEGASAAAELSIHDLVTADPAKRS